jgi:hypothetical protein
MRCWASCKPEHGHEQGNGPEENAKKKALKTFDEKRAAKKAKKAEKTFLHRA